MTFPQALYSGARQAVDIDWTWTPNRKGVDLFDIDLCVCVEFDTNSTFYIDAIYIEGVWLEREDDLFICIRRDLDNSTRFQDYVFEKREAA